MLPTRKFKMLVSRSCFPWGRCLIRKGPGMGLWGPIFSHLITMPSSLVSLIYVNAGWVTRILISLGNTGRQVYCALVLNQQSGPSGLVSTFPSLRLRRSGFSIWQILRCMSSVWLLDLNSFRLNNWETAYSRGCSWGYYLLLCGQNRKKNCGEAIKLQKHWGEFYFVSMGWLPFHFESKGNIVRHPWHLAKCSILIWSLPEASTVLDVGHRGGEYLVLVLYSFNI